MTGATDPRGGSPGQDGAAPSTDRTVSVCMYCPSSRGGHARYTGALLEALVGLSPRRISHAGLVTSEDLLPAYRSDLYRIHAILPALRPRSDFATRAGWAASRLIHYTRRDRRFLRWARDDKQYAVVHVQEYSAWLARRHYRRLQRAGKRVFCTVHNLHPHTELPSMARLLRARLQRGGWRQCDGLFVHSRGLDASLSAWLGPGHPPIYVTRHAVGTPAQPPSRPSEPDDASARARLLLFGMLRPNKGITVLLEAMQLLPDCRLTIAGAPVDDAYMLRVMEGVRRLSPGDVSVMAEYIDDDGIASLFREARVVVLPYTSFAAQSGVLGEAITYGVPVVVTDTGALGETVIELGIGEVVPSGDAAALAAGIRRVLEPRRWAQCAEALRSAAQMLSWTAMAEATADAYTRSAP